MIAASPQMMPIMLKVAATAALFAKKPFEAAPAVGAAKTVDPPSGDTEKPSLLPDELEARGVVDTRFGTTATGVVELVELRYR